MGLEIREDMVVSTMLVSQAVQEDAGQYSCTSKVFRDRDFPRARVQVHVTQGELSIGTTSVLVGKLGPYTRESHEIVFLIRYEVQPSNSCVCYPPKIRSK